MPQRHHVRGALAGLLCAAVAVAFSLTDPTLGGAETFLRDAWSRLLATRHQPDPRVVIVAVTEESTRTLDALGYGRWPYPRTVWAAAIRELVHAGARVIAFDVGLPEEDVRQPAGDRELAEALRGAPVILGVQTDASEALPRDGGTFESDLWKIAGPPPTPEDYGVAFPNRAFGSARGLGTMRLAPPSRTGVVHDYVLADRSGQRYVPSLALEAVRMFLGAPRQGRWERSSFAFAGRSIPMKGGRLDLVWHGRPGPALRYRVIGLEKLLGAARSRSGNGRAAATALEEQLRGRIVLIGVTAFGLFDLRATPLWPASAGVEIHATAIDDLLNGTYLRDAGLSTQFILMLAVAAALGWLLEATRSQWLSAALAALSIGGWVAAGFLSMERGVVVRAMAGISSVVLTYGIVTLLRFADEQRQTDRLTEIFGHYVSPQVLEHILAHPEQVRLGGERRDLTILFSDIRGFTTISEASEPEDVVEMLNEYLDRMAAVLIGHGGTLDKFIGDSVMGFWNAPAPDPNHPLNAVRCALAMVKETALLRARWETEGKPSLRIGVGINTGEAVVGNIGAERLFGYTVIGDAVNLASRMEGQNRDYGTTIIISEFTLARVATEVEAILLDEVKVKGREKAVKIYEVKGLLSPES